MTAVSTTLATKASRFLERRSDRRGFLRRSALVGTALAAAPATYVLKPKTAYAAICNCSGSNCDCGAQCCDGYTEFCCTLSGTNGCPPNTSYGGWWKADGSGYCDNGSPQPRYYLDCNAPCGDCGCGSRGVCSGSCSGTNCGCAAGSCNNRKAGCTGFRYGQCNQNIQCLGPIVCRVVTCTPPWELDATCTTAVRTDNNTRFHNRPCLQEDPGNPQGALVAMQMAPAGVRMVGYVLASAPKAVRLSAGSTTLGDTTARFTAAQVGENEPSGEAVVWFEAEYAVAAGRQTFCASTVNGSAIRRVGCQSFIVPYGSPIGSLDAAVPTGDGRVRLRGWAIDPNTSAKVGVHVYADGQYVGGGVASERRTDVRNAYPAFGAGRGFDIEVEVPTNGIRSLCAYAINQGNGANVRLGCLSVDMRPSAVTGQITSMGQVPGGVMVSGWAVNPASDEDVRVTVLVDGTAVATRAAREERVEFEGLFPSDERHGFSVVVPASAGRHTICVDARLSGGGGSRRIGCAETSVGGSPVGLVESVDERLDRITIKGWAIDPDTAQPVVMHVYVDGVYRTAVRADEPRPDLPFDMGRGGFTIPLSFATAGSHDVKVFALDRTGDPNVLIAQLPVNTRNGSPFGSIQQIDLSGSTLTVQGWAIDPDTSASTPVHIYVDGQYAGGGAANNRRDNIARRYPGYGANHGFRFDIEVSSGNHEVCVFALDQAGNHRSALLECRQVSVP